MNPQPKQNPPLRLVNSATNTASHIELARQIEATPPHDVECEQKILGSMIVERRACVVAMETLTAADFYVGRHKVLFEHLVEIGGIQGLDELLVRNSLKRAGLLSRIGGQNVLSAHIENSSAGAIEGHCADLVRLSRQRQARTIASGLLLAGGDPDTALIDATTELSAMEARRSADTTRYATLAGVEAQIDAEIGGERVDFGWPWPIMSESSAFLPGSTMTLCGSAGKGKSLLVLQMLWKWHFRGVRCSAMNIEKDNEHHFRRVLAQMSGCAGITNDKWCLHNALEAKEILEFYRESMKSLEAAKVYQTPGKLETPTRAMLIGQMKSEIARGTQIMLVDPITNMDPSSKGRLYDEECLVRETNALMGRHQCCCIFVTHPKTNPAGIPLRPDKNNLSGSQAFSRFVDTVFWLVSHGDAMRDDVMQRETLPANPKEYNREIFWLKVKSGIGEGRRVALMYHPHSLTYDEVGLLPEASK